MWRRRQKSLAADVLGITNRHDREASVWGAMELLGYDINTPNPEDTSVLPPAERLLLKEMGLDITIASGLIEGEEVNFPNTLTDWPAHKYMMDRHGRKVKGEGTALMIGSLTAMSSRAFIRFAEQEYKTSRNLVIDLHSTDPKARHGHFLRASGLNLPFMSGSMDIVHTNRLLNMLEDPSSPSAKLEDMMPRLFREITRVLAPRGQVLMYELTPGVKDVETYEEALCFTRSFARVVQGQFEDLGYDTVRTGDGFVLPNTDYLFDASRPNVPDGTTLHAAAFSLYAS